MYFLNAVVLQINSKGCARLMIMSQIWCDSDPNNSSQNSVVQINQEMYSSENSATDCHLAHSDVTRALLVECLHESWIMHSSTKNNISPRPIGVWRVAHSVGGGGCRIGLPVISQIAGPISKIQTPFDSSVRELSKWAVNFDLEVINDVSGQVKVEMINFSGLVTLANKISTLSANKAESARLGWHVLFPVLCDHNTGQV